MATKKSPKVIMLPGGDAILSSKIEMVRVRFGHYEETLNQTYQPGVNVARAERDRIITEWRSLS